MMRLVLALLAAAAMPVPADQVRVVRYGDDRLAGITAVDVVVTLTGDETCGLRLRAVQDSAVAALRRAGIKATASAKASSWFHTVYVRLDSGIAANECVTAAETELVAQVQGIPEADKSAATGAWGSLLVGELSLLRESGLTISSPPAHAARVQATLGEQLATVGERMKKANP